ncbi:MAG: M48 family metalloprotease [Rhodospirillaceae bacterium]|nr:M48 family metalloprotease [Rhodospirillaceae bacterium]
MICNRPNPAWLGIVALLLLALPGCSTNPATGNQSFTAFMSPEDEARIGAEEDKKITKDLGGPYKSPELEAYVRDVGKKLAAVSELPAIPWQFTVLNDHAVNAFALPGGYVYITRGLLAIADNEAEMAGVLAHEIGHVTARHAAQRYSTTMATNLGLTGLSILGSVLGVPSGVGQIISSGAQVAMQQYSQGQELEADMLGMRYMARIGYDPSAATSFFRKLKAHSDLEARQQGKDGVSHNIMSTHPRTEDRIRQAMELAKTKAVTNPIVQREAFLKQIDGMVFGDDPSQGVRKGRTFTHPKLKITFTVPPKFVLFNSTKQVVAFGPERSRVIFDMANPKDAKKARDLRAYLSGVWGRNLKISGVETLDVNGMPAATGQARISDANGTRDVRLLVVRERPERIYRFAFIAKPSEMQRLNVELRRTTYSFRRLSQAQADAIQPLRLEVRPVKAGETATELAARFPFERFQREWFRLLNNLNVGESPRPGQQIKLVVE